MNPTTIGNNTFKLLYLSYFNEKAIVLSKGIKANSFSFSYFHASNHIILILFLQTFRKEITKITMINLKK
jgi:hypothetical protein